MKKSLTYSAALATLAVAIAPVLVDAVPSFGDDVSTEPAPAAAVTAIDEPAPSNGFIISYKEGSSEAAALNTDSGAEQGVDVLDDASKASVAEAVDGIDATVTRSHAGAEQTAVVELDRELNAEEQADVIAKIEADEAVAAVEPNLIATPEAVTPNDTYFSQQWALANNRGGANFQSAWDYSKGNGVTVAVLDTGLARHADVMPNTVAGFDFIRDAKSAGDGDGRDSNPLDEGEAMAANGCWKGFPATTKKSGWHGTHVAGIIGAAQNNRYGVSGAAPGAKVQPLRVMGKCGGDAQDIVDAITWASGGDVPGIVRNPTPAAVINLSLSSRSDTCPSYYQRAIDGAVSRGSTVVVAAGNASIDARKVAPANCNNVIVVGAVGQNAGLAYYSNHGPKVDVFGPGGDQRYDRGILSTVNGSSDRPNNTSALQYLQGTSMAAPHVSAAVALMKSANPSLSPAQIRQILRSSTKSVSSCWAGSGACQAGVLDAAKAVRMARG